jgi:hypothetical protein
MTSDQALRADPPGSADAEPRAPTEPKGAGGIIIIILGVIGIIFASIVIQNMLTQIHDAKPINVVTIQDKTSYTVSQGFFSSRTGFFVITNNGNYEVGTSGGTSADVYALWSSLKPGHRYQIDVSMGLLIGAKEVETP